MILTDAGPLVAIVDRGERSHQVCVDCLSELTGPMLTTWPVFTEAMYLLGQAGGWPAQQALWTLVVQGDLELAPSDATQLTRMQNLMHKYRDRPMDLADASLVALADERGVRDVFTLDRADFQIYRFRRREAFRLWPRPD